MTNVRRNVNDSDKISDHAANNLLTKNDSINFMGVCAP